MHVYTSRCNDINLPGNIWIQESNELFATRQSPFILIVPVSYYLFQYCTRFLLSRILTRIQLRWEKIIFSEIPKLLNLPFRNTCTKKHISMLFFTKKKSVKLTSTSGTKTNRIVKFIFQIKSWYKPRSERNNSRISVS